MEIGTGETDHKFSLGDLQGLPGNRFIDDRILRGIEAERDRRDGFGTLTKSGTVDLPRRPSAIPHKMEIRPLIEPLLDSEILMRVITGMRALLLGTVAAFLAEVIALLRIMTSPGDRNQVVNRPDHRLVLRQRVKETWEI